MRCTREVLPADRPQWSPHLVAEWLVSHSSGLGRVRGERGVREGIPDLRSRHAPGSLDANAAGRSPPSTNWPATGSTCRPTQLRREGPGRESSHAEMSKWVNSLESGPCFGQPECLAVGLSGQKESLMSRTHTCGESHPNGVRPLPESARPVHASAVVHPPSIESGMCRSQGGRNPEVSGDRRRVASMESVHLGGRSYWPRRRPYRLAHKEPEWSPAGGPEYR